MKTNSSLLTECTRLNNLNLIDSDACPPQLITIFTKHNGKVYQIQINLQNQSISNVIVNAIERFKTTFQLTLPTDISSYHLYAAKKNGKICSDYPAFQNDQDIVLTKIFIFYLKYKKPIQIELKNRIKTNFSSEIKKQVKSGNKFFCSCMFSS